MWEKKGNSDYVKVERSENAHTDHPVHWYRNCPVEEPDISSNSRVLVLASDHSETITACGGTIAKLAKRGAHIKVVFMTDVFTLGCVGIYRNLISTFSKEIEDSLAAVRCYEYEHLEKPQMGLRCDFENMFMLNKVISDYSPDIIMLPYLQDPNPHSMITGLLTAWALEDYKFDLTLYSYSTGGGQFLNTMIEITDSFQDKFSALRSLNPKVPVEDIERKTHNPNFIHLTTSNGMQYFEPFLRMDKMEYIKLRYKHVMYI